VQPSMVPVALEEGLDLAELLLKEELLEPEQLRYAQKVRARMENPGPLGEVLVGLKLLSRSEFKKIFKVFKGQLKLSELLQESGILGREQLERARAR